MNLSALRTEVLNHGFDPVQFGSARVNQYLNDGYRLICRRVDYYVEEATSDFTTTVGTSAYPWPTNLARLRSLRLPDFSQELEAVSLRDIDRSTNTSGQPSYYALDGGNVHVYPSPDGVYNLELRYWAMPTELVNDADTPNLPDDWHHLLWVYACAIAFEAEDDSGTSQYFMQRFATELAEFAADAKFPSTDYPTQVQGMWEQDRVLTPAGWSLWLGYG